MSGNGGAAAHGFGIVGCGIISAMHADAIAAVPGARVVEPGLDDLLA
jgi:predicted dehydrogenase